MLFRSRVFIPNGEHQMSFDDVPAGGALVTTDESGVVQDVKLDPCQETDCPFYVRDRLEDYKRDPDSATDFDSAMDEIEQDL